MKKIVPNDAVLIPESAQRVFKGEIYDVYHWPQRMFDGSMANFEMLKRHDTVTVIAISEDGILVVDDEQPHRGKRLSFPGGRVDTGKELTLAAAKRELKEETGYDFKGWKLVHVFQPHTKMEWFIYYYVAFDGAKVSSPKLDVGEKIDVKHMSFSEVKAKVEMSVGYLGEARSVFEGINSVDELINLPEFQGKAIDA